MATPVGCIPNGNNVLFVQTILYFASSFLGFFVTIPVGIVLRNFHGSCILFAQIVNWGTAIIFPWSESSCDFVLYLNLAINIFYATFMGFLTLFMKLRKSRSDKIGLLQDWHVSFVLSGLNPILLFVNVLIVLLELSSAGLVTSGFVKFCNYTMEYAKKVPANTNGTYSYVPTSCAGLDSRWNHQWSQMRIVRGTDRGVIGDNFFGCLTLASIANWLIVAIWIAQLAMNVGMSCRTCSCEIAEEKRKPDQSLQVAQRRSRMATPIGTPGGFTTPGGHFGYGPPQMRPPMSHSGAATPMGGHSMGGPPSRDMSREYRDHPEDHYRDSPIEEKKPIPPSDDEGYYPPPPTMQALPGKQVFRRGAPQDSELI